MDMTTKYPFPSHVSVQSFVTVKLSDKCMYRLWKTQMLRLLDSHDMLGFINESSDPMRAGDDERKLWNRSDALVHGWILGSLSEQAAVAVLNSLESKLHKEAHFTAKHIWDEVQSMYGQHAEQEEERKGGCGSPCIDLMKIVKEEKERSRSKQMLYNVVECGKLEQAVSIIKKQEIRITESISINGNTALHIAVTFRDDDNNEFLKSMLDLTDIPLTEVRNLDGSTPLHLAASLGNANAAKILLDKSPNLWYAKDNHGCTPFDIIHSRPRNKEMCLFLLNNAMPDIEHTDVVGHEPLVVNAISYRHFDAALAFIQRCNSLKSPAVLMAIAQNCPADFTPNRLIIYELFRATVLDFITRCTSDMKGCMKFVIWVLIAVFKYLKESLKERGDARDLLDVVCCLIRSSNEAWSYRDFYTGAMIEAIRRDASDVVEKIMYWFPEAALVVDEDGHNFAQAVWKNRASKIYSLVLDGNLAKHTSLSQEPSLNRHCGNNFLHFAARLGPAKKLDHISCPPFRLQCELQWFKVARELIPHGRRTEKNCLGETPEMVFSKEHKHLEIASEEWIQRLANSVAITATLIIAVMFTSVLQVPGGNNDKGVPHFVSQPAFIIFIICITLSAVASALSLLMFLALLTSPLTQNDFLLRLPLAMVMGYVSLFVSVIVGMLAFGAVLIILFGTNNPWILCLIASLIAVPIFVFWIIYAWYMSNILTDFMYSTGHFLIFQGFRRLKLVGRIFI